MHRRVLLLFGLILITLASLSEGVCLCDDQTTGGRFYLNKDPRYQVANSVAVNSFNGDYLLIYVSDDRPDPALPAVLSIRAQLFSEKGAAKGLATIVQSRLLQPRNGFPKEGLFYARTVVFDRTHNRFLFTWIHHLANPDRYFIKGQFLDTAGQLIGSPFVMKRSKSILELHGFVFNAKTDEFALLYQRSNSIFMQRYDSDGTMIASAVRINRSGLNYQGPARLTLDPIDGRYLVTWIESETTNIDTDQATYQIVNGDLSMIGKNSLLSGNTWWVDGIWNGKMHEFLLSWQEFHRSKYFSQYVSRDGNLLNPVFEPEFVPQVYNPGTSGYLTSFSKGSDLLLSRLNDDLSVAISDVPLSCDFENQPPSQADLIYNPFSKEFLAVWNIRVAVPKEFDIAGVRIRATPLSLHCP